MSEWGRVSDDGTVYVRTADGERAVGSWHAGAPEEGLAHFARRYEQLATEVTLLEARLRSGSGDPRQVAASAERLKESLPTAAAVGDLDALARRVDVLLEKTAGAVEAHQAARAAAKEEAVARLTALAEEAEKLASSSSWKDAGERLRNLGQDWKRVTGVDKKTADALWERVAASRARFVERRTAHFGALEQQRTVSQERKEKLVKEAEKLASSTEWKATAERFKQLMAEWKAAGRAAREVEEQLWQAFKAAQDAFFGARNATFAEKDEELRANQRVKEEILAEAEALEVPGGKARLRQLQERWDAAGKVPRDVMRSLEDRFGKVEEKFRGQGDTSHVRQTESTSSSGSARRSRTSRRSSPRRRPPGSRPATSRRSSRRSAAGWPRRACPSTRRRPPSPRPRRRPPRSRRPPGSARTTERPLP